MYVDNERPGSIQISSVLPTEGFDPVILSGRIQYKEPGVRGKITYNISQIGDTLLPRATCLRNGSRLDSVETLLNLVSLYRLRMASKCNV